ncbi:MAG: DeoR/GlpR transcriptional regulator [Firmicutes bacterium]|nr:DeoR/GlpR transcriptional regulator [Bacillota bacterium]
MIPYVRRQHILAELEKKEIVYLQELCEKFQDTSEATIRRDLKLLEEEGFIDILRGGAAKLRTIAYEVPLKTKERLNTEEKERIARYAASLVEDGEIIYLDSGTTATKMVKYLADKKITVVTSNTEIFPFLAECAFTCLFLGGEVSTVLGSVYGPVTEEQLSNLFFDQAFLGANGYSVKSGINTPDVREARKKRLVMEHSKKTYVLMDSSKANKQTLCKALDFHECIIISDSPNELLENHAKYLLAPADSSAVS